MRKNILEEKKLLTKTAIQRRKKSSFRLRYVFLTCVVVSIYAFITLYKELQQASRVLADFKRESLILIKNNSLETTMHKTNHEATNSETIDVSNEILDNILSFRNTENESVSTRVDFDEEIGRRFQENVLMIRKRFYETHQAKPHETEKTNTKRNAQNIGRDTNIRQYKMKNVFENRTNLPTNKNEYSYKQFKNDFSSEYTKKMGLKKITGRFPKHMSNCNVIIVGYHRSGSSFLGEMFNRNPNAFYIFEPIHTIDVFLDARRRFPALYDTLVRNLLGTIYECNFQKHPLFVNTLTASTFRLKSEALMSGGLCDPRVNSGKMHLCQRLNATFLSQICRSHPHKVIKTIRMVRWENIDFLQHSTHTPAKVIHLVRDPRGIITSRVSWILERLPQFMNSTSNKASEKMLKAISNYIGNVSKDLCTQMINDIKEWTKRSKHDENFAMVRYEDVSKDPLTAYKKISEFTGIAQSQTVIHWLQNNTKYSLDTNYYSTTRNATAVPHMWRSRLTMSFINEIQNHCGNVMNTLGYKLIRNEKERRDTTTSLVIQDDNMGNIRTLPYVRNL